MLSIAIINFGYCEQVIAGFISSC